ncbi:Transcription factor MYC2, partial [Mucuna pruriens]
MVGEKLKSHTASLRAMPNDLGEDLKNLIEGSPQSCWTYAILWRCSSPQSVLTFHDGYCTATESKPKELRILGSSVTVTEDVTDAEWFFRISAAQSFGINEDLPGHAFCGSGPVWVTAEDSDARRWERATWGYQFGIRTVLCIPLKEKGVLELASTEIVPYELKMMEEMVNFIYAIGTPRPPIVPFFLNQFSYSFY